MEILFEDNHVIVVSKPQGVPSQPDESGDKDMLTQVKEYIKEKYNKPGEAFVGLVHRLDRPTGGAMVFAKTSKAASRLSEQMRAGDFDKTYYAVVCGRPRETKGKIVSYLKKDEKTKFNVKSEIAPLKKVLLEKELAEDIESYIDDGSIYPSFGIFLNKTSPSKKELFVKTVFEELKRLKDEGIDRNLLLATININEFKNKELDTGRMPKGLAFAFSIMQGYNYDIPYENYLETSDYYKFFKENLDTGYFESLIEKYILNSNHYVVVTMNPSKELGKIKDEAMKEKMRSLKENMTLEEIKECVKITNDLIAYQNRKDDILDVKKLPELKLSDISTKITPIHTMEEDKDGIHYIYHNVNTNKIAYFRAYFDLGVLSAEELAYARILSRLFVRLDTLNYSADALQSHIKTYLGNIGFSPVVNAKNRDEYIAKMLVTVSSLEENISYIPSILNEIINNESLKVNIDVRRKILYTLMMIIILNHLFLMGN